MLLLRLKAKSVRRAAALMPPTLITCDVFGKIPEILRQLRSPLASTTSRTHATRARGSSSPLFTSSPLLTHLNARYLTPTYVLDRQLWLGLDGVQAQLAPPPKKLSWLTKVLR